MYVVTVDFVVRQKDPACFPEAVAARSRPSRAALEAQLRTAHFPDVHAAARPVVTSTRVRTWRLLPKGGR